MSQKQKNVPVVSIFPLTFLQIAQSSDAVVRALQEHDVQAQDWFGSSRLLQSFMTATGVPLYYHWFTSAYGAFVDDKAVGWLFLRGWRQVLYVEGLVVAQDSRRKGIGAALMDFAEQQARDLHRDWLGLTVTIANDSAVNLYEQQGFQRGHGRILRYEGQAAPALPGSAVDLRPVIAQTAAQIYAHFADRDLAAGDADTAQVQNRFLGREPYRSVLGSHWLIRGSNGKPVGYLHRHRARQRTVVYLAALQEHWASAEMIGALAKVTASLSRSPIMLEVRFASDGHHDAMCQALVPCGFVERPAVTMKMFKHLV
jgi:GNAT superfamily N-acetyltransferase